MITRNAYNLFRKVAAEEHPAATVINKPLAKSMDFARAAEAVRGAATDWKKWRATPDYKVMLEKDLDNLWGADNKPLPNVDPAAYFMNLKREAQRAAGFPTDIETIKRVNDPIKRREAVYNAGNKHRRAMEARNDLKLPAKREINEQLRLLNRYKNRHIMNEWGKGFLSAYPDMYDKLTDSLASGLLNTADMVKAGVNKTKNLAKKVLY